MLLAALSLTFATAGAPACWLDTKGLDYEGQITALCLQGIVNRDAPRLFLDTAPIYWQWPPADRHWRQYLEKAKGYSFTDLANLPAAIDHFRDRLGGLVVYDPAECDAERAIACTYASVEGLLPVTPGYLAAHHAALAGLAVREDLRGKFSDALAAYRWAEENLLGRCAHGLCYSLGHSFPGTDLGGDPAVNLSLDYVVSRRGFVFDLSPEDQREGKWAAHPEQAAMFGEIVRKLGPLAGVWGWSEPEGAFARNVSKSGGYIMCPGPNLSFWRHVPAATRRLPTPPRHVRKLEDKAYLCFQTNEGDTPKILCAFFAGGWLSAERGSEPVAWGIDPLIGDLCPALFEYYARTASPEDSFFCGVSGAGYCYPDLMPDAEACYRWSQRHISATNVPAADVWLWAGHAPLAVFEKYHEAAPAVKGFTMLPKPDPMNRWLPDATPVLSSTGGLFYYNSGPGAPERLAARVRQVAASLPRPCFIPLYGGVGPGIYDIVRETMKRLGPGYEACTMDDFMALAREAGRFEVEVKPKYLAPGAKAEALLTFRDVGGAGEAGKAGKAAFRAPEARVEAFGQSTRVSAPAQKPSADEAEVRVGLAPPAGTKPGRYQVTARSGDQVRHAPVVLAAGATTISDFASAKGWVQVDAKLTAKGEGDVTCPANLPFAHIQRPIEVDFSRDPVIEISVTACDGAWALKANDGTMPSDAYLIHDTSATGTLDVRLRDALPQWHGKKHFDLILYVCGGGKSVTVKDVRLLYLR